jgi:hypothetical protein
LLGPLGLLGPLPTVLPPLLSVLELPLPDPVDAVPRTFAPLELLPDDEGSSVDGIVAVGWQRIASIEPAGALAQLLALCA